MKNQTKRRKFVRKVAPVIISSAVTAVSMYAYFHRDIALILTEDSVDKMRDGYTAHYDTPRNGTIYLQMPEHVK